MNIKNIIIMKGGARPGGMDHTVYDEKVVKDGKRFNPGELSLEARSYLDEQCLHRYRSEDYSLWQGNPWHCRLQAPVGLHRCFRARYLP